MHDRTRKTYDLTAEAYAQNVASLHPEAFAQRFLAMLPQKAAILDVGCGPGRDARIFSELGYQVTGIDFSPKMVALASEGAPKASFFVMDMMTISLPAEAFDGVWMSASLLHVPKTQVLTVLNQVRHVLKTAGSLYVSVKKGIGEAVEPDARYNGEEKFWSYFIEDELRLYLGQAGFEVLDILETAPDSSYQTHPILRAFARK